MRQLSGCPFPVDDNVLKMNHLKKNEMNRLQNLKNKVLLLLLLAVAGLAKAQQWKELHTGVDEPLFDICCINTSNVLACGPNGLIVKTEDGGQTWEQKNSNAEANLFLLKFANEQVGFACGEETLLKTTDGGESWINVETNPEMGFHYGYGTLSQPNLFLVDADTIYVTDSYNNLWKSIDCGESFEKALDLQYTMEDFYKFDLCFEDNVGYLVGYDSSLFPLGLTAFKTLDYGKTWEAIEFNECESRLSAVHFVDKDHVRLFGYFATSPDEYYGILETSDGLGSYSLLQPIELWAGFPDPWGYGEFLAFSSEKTGCFVYSLTSVKGQSDIQSFALLTHDNGETWAQAPTGINEENYLFSVDGVDSVFYIASINGYVYRIDDINYAGINEKVDCVKVFPNPAMDIVYIEGAEAAEVQVYNALGQLVKTVQNTNEVNLEGLLQGVYLLRVRDAEGAVFVKRVTVCR